MVKVPCGEPPILTVQEYGEQCAAIGEAVPDLETLETWGEWHDAFAAGLRGLQELEPPAELATYHAAYLKELDAAVTILGSEDPSAAIGLGGLILLSAGAKPQTEARNQAFQDLPATLQQALLDTGCRTESE